LITELRVPELVPVLGSQHAGDVSHKPGGRLLGALILKILEFPYNTVWDRSKEAPVPKTSLIRPELSYFNLEL